MSECRDWLSTLWPASYKGFPFYFLSDEEEGGLGLVVHTFPNRDKPYIEDLGEEPRYYSGQAYVHGDNADAKAAAFIASLVSHGPGVLTLPIVGPVLVRAMPFKRKHDKDKLGFVAFDVKFVREGAATPLISIPLAANLAFAAADALAAVLAPALAAAFTLAGQAQHVVAAAADGVATAAAALDTLRLTNPVDATASAKARDAIAAIVAQAPTVISAETIQGTTTNGAVPTTADVAALAASLVSTTRALADAMNPDAAAAAMLDLADAFVFAPAPVYLAPSEALAAVNTAVASQLARLAALTAWAEAVLRRSYASRPRGVEARAKVAERFEAELEAATGSENGELFVAIQDLRGRVTDYLTRLIADLAPVVTVEARIIAPSLVWAWRLYADPLRSDELVARNSVRHPSFMPPTFEALAPT